MSVFEELKKVDDRYTPIPFWFWNDYLTEDEILRQMHEMKDKGVDAFVIHPRKGLPDEILYLSDEYFRYVKFAVKKASEMGMKVVLYDEAMYPSGSCRGMVVKSNEKYASQGLEMTDVSHTTSGGKRIAELSTAEGKKYFNLVPSGGNIRGVHENEDDGEVNAPKSSDLLNPEAVAEFIRLTHEKYYSELNEYFGSTIIAFFTDEPCILGRNPKEGLIPWSDGIYEEFLEAGGKAEDLQLLFDHENDSENNKAKRIYNEVIHNRMSTAYYGQLAKWCKEHGIALTGHPEKSTDIGYLQNFTWPSQDIVWRFVEPEDGHAIIGEHTTMGKCSSDSARHRGKARNGNECFGCCGHREDPYLFTEEDMRWYLNWLFVRGVNLVFPHAFYYSVREDRGDERPPEVGMHNPFWPEYKKLSDYIKRMCALNTNARNMARIAIICSREELSWKIAKPLFENQVEFNYLEEELLNNCAVIKDGKACITDYEYSVLVYDDAFDDNMSSETKVKLQQFENCGGVVLKYTNDKELISKIHSLGLSVLKLKKGSKDIRCSYQEKENTEYVIVTNEGMEDIQDELIVENKKVVEVWDPYTNEVEKDSVGEDGLAVLKIKKYESRILFLE